MDKYDELAQAIVDYEEIGYYDLIDAYDTLENAFECISSDLRAGKIDLEDLCIKFNQSILYEDLDDDARELAYHITRLANDVAEDKFINMVNIYRALGYRMVVFDVPNGASWLCCFDTKGVDADHFPIEAFANEDWLRDLHNYASWSGPLEDVEHMDVTDDEGEMIGGYDYFANFPVMQLASDWQ